MKFVISYEKILINDFYRSNFNFLHIIWGMSMINDFSALSHVMEKEEGNQGFMEIPPINSLPFFSKNYVE